LITTLNDPNATVRNHAFIGLGRVLRSLFPYRRFDLESAGYSPKGAAAKREDAVQKIRAWWAANKD